MPEPDIERLRDLALAAAVTAPADAPYRVRAGAAVWVVLLDPEGLPQAAVPPGALLAGQVSLLPPAVVVDAALPVDDALRSAAFAALEEDSPVIVVDGNRVVGVWAGLDLDLALMRGPARRATDAALPGEIAVPEIRRTCRYEDEGGRCPRVRSFVEKPDDLPWCPGGDGLAPHTFGW